MTPVNPNNMHNPWQSRVKSWTQSNTVQSTVFPLLICVALVALGHGFPEYASPQITTYAEGGAVACLGVLIWRVTVQKDKLQGQKPKP